MIKNNPSTPPPSTTLPIIQKLIVAYKLWHGYFVRLDKSHKYTIGLDIDNLFRETIKQLLSASFKNREQKLYRLTQASDTFDILKFMLHIIWEIGLLDNKKYIALSEPLNEVGRMLGGWHKQTKTPSRSF